MNPRRIDLILLEQSLAVCKPNAAEDIPSWATRSPFFSITRTTDELSIVCEESAVPEGTRAEKGWRVLRVAGSMDFSLVGVLASLTTPIAAANIGLFALSTFDTDYVLIKASDLANAIAALRAYGHIVHDDLG